MPNWRLAPLMRGCAKIGFWKVMRACPPHPRWKLQPRTSIKPSETATLPSPLLHLLIRVYLFITCRHSLTPTAANINDVGIMRTKHFIVLPPYPHPPAPPFPSLFIYASSPKMHINTNGDDGATGRERERETANWSGWWDGERETVIDWESARENQRRRTGGWGMDAGRRRRGEINMALIVSSAPLLSLDQPFITPPQSVQHRHFGKWGPPLGPSVKTAA